MICRLCIKNLSPESAIRLFETNETIAETKLVKIISKFLHLEITRYDAYSTYVCSECCDHLEDFNHFTELVQQKQFTLQNHFLTVNCDMVMTTLNSDDNGNAKDDDDDDVDVDVKSKLRDIVTEEVHNVNNADDDEDEKPLDLNMINISTIMVTEGGGSMDDGKMHCFATKARTKSSPSKIQPPSTPTSSSDLAIEEFSEAKLIESEDDEVPLINLFKKLKRKFQPRKRNRKYYQENKINKENLSKLLNKPRRTHSEYHVFDVDTSNADEVATTTVATTTSLGLSDLLECKTKGVSKKKLSLHYEEVIASFMEAKCDLCDFSTMYFKGLRLHFLQVHQREPYMKCCDKIFSRPSKMMDHVRKHLNPDVFKCTICNKSLSSKDYLQTHMETIHYKTETVSAPSLACNKCDKLFSSQKRLDNHLSKHDNDQLHYDCDLCNKSFANAHRLRRHIQSIHENVFPHVCDICGKKFKFKPSFERHLNEHQGVIAQPMQCSRCNVWLKNEHSLRLHAFTHDRVNTECKSCGKICSSRTALGAHIKYAHRLVEDLPCNFCSKTFKQRRNLEEHMAIHTGLQLYTCPHCPKECRSRSNMYVHVKQRHPEEWLRAKRARSNNPNERSPTEKDV